MATYLNHSGVAASSFGNIVLGGGVGAIIDSASGADNKYTPDVNITLPLARDPSSNPELPAILGPSAEK